MFRPSIGPMRMQPSACGLNLGPILRKSTIALFRALCATLLMTPPVLSASSDRSQDECHRIEKVNRAYWKNSESWAWSRLCRGKSADFNKKLKVKLDPRNPNHDDSWDDDRRLDPDFLQTILTNNSMQRMLGEDSVTIVGAFFPTGVNLDNVLVPNPLKLRRSYIARNVDMERTTFTKSMIFETVKITGRVDMDFVSANQDIVFRDGRFDDLSMRQSELAGNLKLRRSIFKGTVRLASTSVEGNLEMNKSTFRTVDLRRASVAGDIDMRFSTIGRSLDMRRAQLLGDIKTRRTTVCTTGSLNHIDVGPDVDLRLLSLGRLDLSNARVGGMLELLIPSGGDQLVPCLDQNKSKVTARLILQDATVGALKDSRHSWPENLERELDGFKYSRLGEIGENDHRAPFRRSAGWFVQWLAKDTSYTPQPYVHLAHIMEASGQAGMANDIRFARWERKRAELDVSEFRWWFLSALRVTMGYGQGWYNFLPLVWVTMLTVVGAVIVRVFREMDKNGYPLGFWYSLDMLLPVVQLHGLHYETHLVTAAKYYFIVHKLLGYLLVFLVISGLTAVLTDVVE